MPTRRLALRREALAELADADLRRVAAGAPTDMTCFSCLDYLSCNPADCWFSDRGPVCVEA